MVELRTGNLLEADVEALVNTVNTVGVMGKGVALQFKQAFPENFAAYAHACERGEVKPGQMFVYATQVLTGPQFIINFPTKRHWKGNSRIEDIESGLKDLVVRIKELGIRSIALPPLGCGFGGLLWRDVRPRIEAALEQIPEVHALLFAPTGAPEAETMPVRTKRPQMTTSVAALLGLFLRYRVPGYRLSALEVQKLAYFLQVFGEPLKLQFVKHKYGPYAEKLNHWLQRLEGHFIRGYGDRSRDASVYVLPAMEEEVQAKLAESLETAKRVESVAKFIEGFESPYGMELLATAHWIVASAASTRDSTDDVVREFRAWNERKAKLFTEEHILIGVQRARGTPGWTSGEAASNFAEGNA